MPHTKVIRFHFNTITDQILKDKDVFPETMSFWFPAPPQLMSNQVLMGNSIIPLQASLRSGFQVASSTALDIKKERKEERRKCNWPCFTHDSLQLLSTKE